MKIALFSDLHVELHNGYPRIDAAADVVVLAGDIHTRGATIDVARAIRNECGKPVIVVAGNHEHYGQELSLSLQQLREAARAEEAIHFLENDAVVIDGVRFLGCTLWSDFASNGLAAAEGVMQLAQRYIPDFSCIRYGDSRFTPVHATKFFTASCKWLQEQLALPFAGKTVIITHFAPHAAAVHANFLQPGMNALTPYFTPDCSALIQRFTPALWCYGHTHNSVDVVLQGGTRLVSNQRGYPDEAAAYTQFDASKLLIM